MGLPLDLVSWGDLFVQHEVSVAEEIARRKVPRAELLNAVVHSDFNDIAPALRDRVMAAGISPTEVTETLGGVGLLQLVQSLPTRRVTNALRVSKHLHPAQHQKWKVNDFIDVVQLPVPAVYCDVVFTEQQWVRALTRDKDDKLDERFDTKLSSNPSSWSRCWSPRACDGESDDPVHRRERQLTMAPSPRTGSPGLTAPAGTNLDTLGGQRSSHRLLAYVEAQPDLHQRQPTRVQLDRFGQVALFKTAPSDWDRATEEVRRCCAAMHVESLTQLH
ncbi:hypothetical protein BN11_4710002 [Nostocoides australiense Ben110]|uniref:Uncharacterized protein n=1 Tax=Nostocoides australiense Ben110 TaxID=1193182 RepID=W6K0U1_9MICO|nr:hypothetical protein BN11_4710002 [Tetrasphaera australiensis Ben110]